MGRDDGTDLTPVGILPPWAESAKAGFFDTVTLLN